MLTSRTRRSRRPDAEDRPAPLRVAFYSHDTVGLGHTRRNLALASAIVGASGATDVLVLTGNPEAGALPLPPHTDIVTLPTITKDRAGHYRSRVLHSPLPMVLKIRSQVIEAALTAFEPDLLIVDKVSRGVGDELLPALSQLARRGRTRVVLGLREILDEPVAAVREWEAMGTSQTIAEFYDAVWVYGDQAVYDPVVEYGLPPEVEHKITYTGYLSHGRSADVGTRPAGASRPPADPYVLCLVGGGQDGFDLADTFVRTSMPTGYRGVVLSGPFMTSTARQRLRNLAAANAGITVHDFVSNAGEFLADAAAVVSMAGYNSACEILATPTPALFVPRTRLRAEQLVRAQRLAERGLADLVTMDDLDPVRLQGWLARAVTDCGHGATRASSGVDLGGLQTVPGLVAKLVGGLHHAA